MRKTHWVGALALTLALVTSVSPSGFGEALKSSNSGSAAAVKAAAAAFTIDSVRAQRNLAELTKEPHAFGSPRQKQLGRWLKSELSKDGLAADLQDFEAVTPAPLTLVGAFAQTTTRQVPGANVLATAGAKPRECVIALASHYDTKDIPGMRFVGANDSGSSTVLLLQLMAYLRKLQLARELPCGFVGWFFDGEEAVLANWYDGEYAHPAHLIDHTYGSRHAVSTLVDCSFRGKPAKCLPKSRDGKNKAAGPALLGLVLLDLVGSPDLRITRDLTSTPRLSDLVKQGARELGMPELYDLRGGHIEDDHTAFLAADIPAVNLIDFSNLTHWHKASDTAEKVAMPSLTKAGRLALWVALTLAASPT